MRHILKTAYHTLLSRRGFSLVEMIIYIALLAIILVSLLSAVNLMLRSWRSAAARTTLAASGSLAMERLAHEIRAATGVDAGSSFIASSSMLKLDSTDAWGNATTTTFGVWKGMLYVNFGTAASTSLLKPDVGVNGFTAYHITTANSDGVRVILELWAATTSATTSAVFYDTTILRGSY